MFFKVLKHDFISTGRIMGIIYIIVAGISAFTLGSHYLKKGDDMAIGEALGVAALLLVSMCMFILTAVVVLTSFHKTLYGDQGYLTFTLPVKSWKILLSKVLVSTSWFVIALAALFGSMWVTAVVLKQEVLGENYELIMDLISQFSTVNVPELIATIIAKIIVFFVEFAFFTITIFFTSTLANTRLFQKRSILWTIVLFVPIAAAAVKLAEFFNQHIVFALFFIDNKLKLVTDNFEYQSLLLNNNAIDIGELFVYFILGAGIFFATHYIMSKKVNIK